MSDAVKIVIYVVGYVAIAMLIITAINAFQATKGADAVNNTDWEDLLPVAIFWPLCLACMLLLGGGWLFFYFLPKVAGVGLIKGTTRIREYAQRKTVKSLPPEMPLWMKTEPTEPQHKPGQWIN